MITEIDPKIILWEKKIQGLCRKPYYNHPKGCPNFNKKNGCPPQPPIEKIFNLEDKLFVIYTSFPVGEFAERMRVEHPQWNEHPRQWYNPRRWQPRARKEHNGEIQHFLSNFPQYTINKCPEAHGINVTDLMKKLGIELRWDWPPNHDHYKDNITYIVSLGGKNKFDI